jgi:DNA processing protein
VASLRESVAPPADLVEAMVRALALPAGGPEALSEAVSRYGGAAGGARALVRQRLPRMDAAARDRWEGWVERCLGLLRSGDVRPLVRGYAGYPGELMALDVPPPILFARGRTGLLSEPMVAVVGTRRCTEEGRRTAERIAGGLAAAGVVVVSGLALGIDGAAHRAAGTRRTVAVLGCGVDVPYPRSHTRLYDAIARDGLLISERLPGTPPYPFLFPERNRIIAGLSRAVVLVEAPASSGALITADFARDLERDVFAAPGPLGSRHYEGSNARIRDGLATLVTGPEEVLRRVGVAVPEDFADRAPPDLEGVGLALWRAVGQGVATADELAEAVGLDAGQGLASLLALEVQGHIRQLPGMRFVRSRTVAASGG